MIPTADNHIRGGLLAHWLRRCVHLSIILVPFIYHFYPHWFSHASISARQCVLLILFLITIIEAIRLLGGWVWFGQRAYEKRRISSFAQGAWGIGLVILFLPFIYAVPVIASCAIGDPLLGELRRAGLSKFWVMFIGIISVGLIWWFCGIWLLFSPLWALVMAPITVLVEWPNLKWFDDNFLMLVVPLLILKIFG